MRARVLLPRFTGKPSKIAVCLVLVSLPFAAVPLRNHIVEGSALCSLVPFGRIKRDSQPYFIGIAQFDTLLAGPGSTEFKLDQGHYGRARERPIYGQLIRVEKWGGNQPALQAASGSTAVVVPWDYAADCSTTPWGGHWVWLRTGDRMVFSPQLRDRKYWIDGHPTFDAFSPQFDAYPVRYEDPVMGRQPTGLTVDQLFELLELVPSAEQISQLGWAATENVGQWAKTHPELAASYPAREVGINLSWEAGDSHARHINSPLLGTYRFWLTYPNGRQRQFFVRTSDRPVGAWHIIRPSREEPRAREWLTFPDGYQLRLWVATSGGALPTEPDWRKRYNFELGVRELGESANDSTMWRAEFETSGLYLFKILNDPELDSLMSKHFAWFFARYDSGRVSPDPGTFVKHSDGRITFEQPIQLADSTQIILRAVRLSTRAVKDTVCYRPSC
jgi:hypothetical protein